MRAADIHAGFAAAPKIDPKTPDCVRYHVKKKRYELVVGGEVKATISRFAMSVPNCKRKFVEAVRAAAAGQRIDEAVDRLYPEGE